MIYSAIICSTTTLAEYSEEQGDFQTTFIKLLRANRQPLEFYAVPYQTYEFYFLHKNEYTFGCISNVNLDNEKILIYLQTLKERFFSINEKEKDNLMLKLTSMIKELMVF